MKIYNFSSSNIVNAKQGDKNLRLNTWSVLLPNLSPEVPIDCNPKDNTKGGDYFVIPSFGTPFNQTVNSCIQNVTTIPSTTVDLTNNPNVYNGSVRCLWPAPNFGYFDSNQLAFPEPDSYLNFITTDQTSQTPLHFLTQNTYTKIEEVFSVFEKKILDTFELEFLNFCKPISNATVSGDVSTFGQSTVNLNANFKNFQSLFKSLMTVPSKVQGETDEQYFTNTINNQYSFVHPENPTIKGCTHILWTGAVLDKFSSARNAVFYGDKAIDRSPCGTGTSARMAQWYAKGKLKKGDTSVSPFFFVLRQKLFRRGHVKTDCTKKII